MNSIKGFVCFLFTVLLVKQSAAQTLEFELRAADIDSLAVESDGLMPSCIMFLFTVKNCSSTKKILFKDIPWGADINFGRLIYFDAEKKKYHYLLLKPHLGYLVNRTDGGLEVGGNDSAKFVAYVDLVDMFLFCNKKFGVITGRFLTSFVQNGRFFYLPGAYRKSKERSAIIPAEAVEIKKMQGLSICYNASCLWDK